MKLTDTYTSNGGAASSSIAASGKAVYNTYNTLNTKFASYLPLAGGTMTGDLTVKGNATTTANIGANGLELNGSSVHGGYIDFHYGKSTKDFTTRLIENFEGELWITIGSTGKSYKIIHSGNIGTYL